MAYENTVEAVRAAVIDAFARMDRWFDEPADVRSFEPASGAWSIDRILEHVSLTNHYLMLTLRKAVATAVARASRGQAIPGGESDLDRLAAIGQHGSFRWVRPAHMVPTGQKSSAEVRELLNAQREECLKLLEQMGRGEGALCQLRMSVNGLGRIDLYQWLFFLAQHARRHLQQLESVKIEAGR